MRQGARAYASCCTRAMPHNPQTTTHAPTPTAPTTTTDHHHRPPTTGHKGAASRKVW